MADKIRVNVTLDDGSTEVLRVLAFKLGYVDKGIGNVSGLIQAIANGELTVLPSIQSEVQYLESLPSVKLYKRLTNG